MGYYTVFTYILSYVLAVQLWKLIAPQTAVTYINIKSVIASLNECVCAFLYALSLFCTLEIKTSCYSYMGVTSVH